MNFKLKDILIATDECVMPNCDKSLTIGNEYEVVKLRKYEFAIINDRGGEHWFDVRKSNHAYWKKYLKLK